MASTGQGIEFDSAQIMGMIPHRYPFLLIDRVTEVVTGASAVGIKAVTIDDTCLQGMPRKQPVMPGVLIIEAMAQTAAVLVVHTLGPESVGKLIYFMGLSNVRFREAVKPGDRLLLRVAKVRSHGPISKVRGTALVGDRVVAEATMNAMIVDYRGKL